MLEVVRRVTRNPRDNRAFAIVCDSLCDLPLPVFEAAGVVPLAQVVRVAGTDYRDCVDLDPSDFYVQISSTHGQVNTFAPSLDEYVATYNRLVAEGWNDVVSLHASSAMSDSFALAQEAASRVTGARVEVVDSCGTSGQLALVLACLVSARDGGCDTDEALARVREGALAARCLVVPAPDARPTLSKLRPKPGLLRRADSLRVRAMGARRLFAISDGGESREVMRATDLQRLAGSMARTMSSYSQVVGPLTYVEISAGVPRLLSIIEKPLDTNEFVSDRAAVLNTNPCTTCQLGIGAVGIAYMPSSLLSAREASGILCMQD